MSGEAREKDDFDPEPVWRAYYGTLNALYAARAEQEKIIDYFLFSLIMNAVLLVGLGVSLFFLFGEV